MEPANNALQISRELIEFRNILVDGIQPSTQCYHEYYKLSDCVVQNKLNILNHDSVRATCDVNAWKAVCPGGIRRNHIEKIYRRTLDNRLYTQDQLNIYMESKNDVKHWGIIDPRY